MIRKNFGLKSLCRKIIVLLDEQTVLKINNAQKI